MPRIPKNDRDGYMFIRNHFVHQGEMPSLRIIAEGIGYKSPRSVQLMLERLRKEGQIYYSGGKIGLVHNPQISVGEHTVEIPVVGSVSCGSLAFADQVDESNVQVSTTIAKPAYKYFILKATGDSMNLSGINDGDLVLVQQQPTANEGQRVVGLVNDEATIKHFHREKGVVVLRPNSTDKTIRPIILSEEFIIQGIVIQTLPNPI